MALLHFIINLIILVGFCIGLVVCAYLFYIGLFLFVVTLEYFIHKLYVVFKNKIDAKE